MKAGAFTSAPQRRTIKPGDRVTAPSAASATITKERQKFLDALANEPPSRSSAARSRSVGAPATRTTTSRDGDDDPMARAARLGLKRASMFQATPASSASDDDGNDDNARPSRKSSGGPPPLPARRLSAATAQATRPRPPPPRADHEDNRSAKTEASTESHENKAATEPDAAAQASTSSFFGSFWNKTTQILGGASAADEDNRVSKHEPPPSEITPFIIDQDKAAVVEAKKREEEAEHAPAKAESTTKGKEEDEPKTTEKAASTSSHVGRSKSDPVRSKVEPITWHRPPPVHPRDFVLAQAASHSASKQKEGRTPFDWLEQSDYKPLDCFLFHRLPNRAATRLARGARPRPPVAAMSFPGPTTVPHFAPPIRATPFPPAPMPSHMRTYSAPIMPPPTPPAAPQVNNELLRQRAQQEAAQHQLAMQQQQAAQQAQLANAARASQQQQQTSPSPQPQRAVHNPPQIPVAPPAITSSVPSLASPAPPTPIPPIPAPTPPGPVPTSIPFYPHSIQQVYHQGGAVQGPGSQAILAPPGQSHPPPPPPPPPAAPTLPFPAPPTLQPGNRVTTSQGPAQSALPTASQAQSNWPSAQASQQWPPTGVPQSPWPPSINANWSHQVPGSQVPAPIPPWPQTMGAPLQHSDGLPDFTPLSTLPPPSSGPVSIPQYSAASLYASPSPGIAAASPAFAGLAHLSAPSSTPGIAPSPIQPLPASQPQIASPTPSPIHPPSVIPEPSATPTNAATVRGLYLGHVAASMGAAFAAAERSSPRPLDPDVDAASLDEAEPETNPKIVEEPNGGPPTLSVIVPDEPNPASSASFLLTPPTPSTIRPGQEETSEPSDEKEEGPQSPPEEIDSEGEEESDDESRTVVPALPQLSLDWQLPDLGFDLGVEGTDLLATVALKSSSIDFLSALGGPSGLGKLETQDDGRLPFPVRSSSPSFAPAMDDLTEGGDDDDEVPQDWDDAFDATTAWVTRFKEADLQVAAKDAQHSSRMARWVADQGVTPVKVAQFAALPLENEAVPASSNENGVNGHGLEDRQLLGPSMHRPRTAPPSTVPPDHLTRPSTAPSSATQESATAPSWLEPTPTLDEIRTRAAILRDATSTGEDSVDEDAPPSPTTADFDTTPIVSRSRAVSAAERNNVFGGSALSVPEEKEVARTVAISLSTPTSTTARQTTTTAIMSSMELSTSPPKVTAVPELKVSESPLTPDAVSPGTTSIVSPGPSSISRPPSVAQRLAPDLAPKLSLRLSPKRAAELQARREAKAQSSLSSSSGLILSTGDEIVTGKETGVNDGSTKETAPKSELDDLFSGW